MGLLEADLPLDSVVDSGFYGLLCHSNLHPDDASYLRGRRYNSEKRQDGGHGNQIAEGNSCPPVPTAESLASEYKVSPRTIKNDGQYAAAVDALVRGNGVYRTETIGLSWG